MNIPTDTLQAAVGQMLEEMYFCDGVWIGPGPLAPAVGAKVSFKGVLDGEIRIAATPRLAAQLAADFLALDASEISESEAASLVAEFTNVACGAALNAWMPDGDFVFSVPETLTDANPAGQWPQRFCVQGVEPELAVDLVITGGV